MSKPPDKETLVQYLARVLSVEDYEEMLERYGGRRIYIPKSFNYAERNEAIRLEYKHMIRMGVRPGDALRILAGEHLLTQRRIAQILVKRTT